MDETILGVIAIGALAVALGWMALELRRLSAQIAPLLASPLARTLTSG